MADDDATGEVAEIYRQELEHEGFVSESARCMTTRPEFLPAWATFLRGIKQQMSLSPREWRLTTFLSSVRVRSGYCALIFGRMLVDDLGSAQAVLRVLEDYHAADLTAREVAILEYSDKISLDPQSIRETDIEKLRRAGLVDKEIFDIALCSSLRQFMGRMFMALGAEPDPQDFAAIESPELRNALTFRDANGGPSKR